MNKNTSTQTKPKGGWQALGHILPVIAIDSLESVDYIIESLMNAGISAVEITLRTPIALKAIAHCVRKFPECLVGAGTVLSRDDLDRVIQVGAQFALSPGFCPQLVASAQSNDFPFIPGVATPSEVMAGLQLGLTHFKLFPAAVLGGVEMLKALNGPMPNAKFCPTGGVQPESIKQFLDQPNVYAVGMTRLVPKDLVERKDWTALTALAKRCLEG